MLSSFEEKEGYILHKVKGLYTYQDIERLIEYVDPVIEKDPNAKFLLDYSEVTNYEQKAMKMAYDRTEKGFPRGVRIAVVYQRKGFLRYIIDAITKAMSKNAKLFDDPQEAKKWLLNQPS